MRSKRVRKFLKDIFVRLDLGVSSIAYNYIA